MQIPAGVAYRVELAALDSATGLPYAGGATVYALVRDATTDKFWNNTTSAWVASEPTLASNLPATAEGNGDFSLTIPVAATTGLSGDTLRVRLLTTYTEAAEVLVSEVVTLVLTGAVEVSTTPSVSGVTGTMIVDLAAQVLNDAGHVTWTEANLLAWINAGQIDVAAKKPEAYVLTLALQLSPGTRQALPTGYSALVRPTRNLGADGTTPGTVPDLFPLEFLGGLHPSWNTDAAAGAVKAVLVDAKAPRVFYVWPPQPSVAQHYLELLLAGVPPGLSALTDALALDDSYEAALLNYVLFRAFSYETTSQTMLARSAAHYSLYLQALGVQSPAGATA